VRRILILSAVLALVAPGGMAAFRSTKPAPAHPEIIFCGRPQVKSLSFHPPVTGPHPGALILSGGSWLVASADIGGAVVLMPGTYAAICDSKIGGAVMGDHTAGLEICSSTVGGGIAISNSMGPVLIGDNGDGEPYSVAGGGRLCGGNLLTGHGAISLTGNTGNIIEVAKNTIGGGVTLNNNHVAPVLGDDIGESEYTPEVEGNTINSSLSCTGNTPMPTNDAQPNTVVGARDGQCSAPGF
jgi:hypothetical protein